MNKTKIEWCDRTWNPVTGCLHECEYCYARRIAKRFGTLDRDEAGEGLEFVLDTPERFYELNEPVRDSEGKIEPYPADFYPTLHYYRMDEPQRKTKPQTIFVCSMADLFGDWVPDSWIEEVFAACVKAPQHRYRNDTARWRGWDFSLRQIISGTAHLLQPHKLHFGGATVTIPLSASNR